MDGIYQVKLQDRSFEKLDQHESYVSSVRVVDSTVISAGYDGRLQWFDLETRKRVRQVELHDFWSWDMALSPDGRQIASVTGQYLAGGYRYEPAPEREPSVKIVAADSGETLHRWPHVPSVQAVAFSPDGRFVAAGNLMGEIRIWELGSGDLVSTWTTPDFTSWGIIKSHCYLGGIFAMEFTRDGNHLLLAGMGPMRDPMAGNGRQLWQKWAWREQPPKKVDETHEGDSGEGLMEALALSPAGDQFAMGGRLRGGDWNVGVFDTESGNRIAILKTGYRVTDLRYSDDARQLLVVGTQGQPADKQGDGYPHFGRVEVYDVA
jgi:WD40 repeat protein